MGARSPIKSSQSQSSLAMSARKNESMMEVLVAQDRKEQLADALYRRAQAKLLFQGGDSHAQVMGALKDAEQVSEWRCMDVDVVSLLFDINCVFYTVM